MCIHTCMHAHMYKQRCLQSPEETMLDYLLLEDGCGPWDVGDRCWTLGLYKSRATFGVALSHVWDWASHRGSLASQWFPRFCLPQSPWFQRHRFPLPPTAFPRKCCRSWAWKSGTLVTEPISPRPCGWDLISSILWLSHHLLDPVAEPSPRPCGWAIS